MPWLTTSLFYSCYDTKQYFFSLLIVCLLREQLPVVQLYTQKHSHTHTFVHVWLLKPSSSKKSTLQVNWMKGSAN